MLHDAPPTASPQVTSHHHTPIAHDDPDAC
jgi:exocyst complex component 4